MSGIRIVGILIALAGVAAHVYVARRCRPLRWFIVGGAVLELIGVSILAATR